MKIENFKCECVNVWRTSKRNKRCDEMFGNIGISDVIGKREKRGEGREKMNQNAQKTIRSSPKQEKAMKMDQKIVKKKMKHVRKKE